MDHEFIGRHKELQELDRFTKKQTASLIVVQGRRRIGKSRLVAEFGKKYKFYQFTGMPPVKGTTAQDQRNLFSYELSQQTGLPEIKVDDWYKLFGFFADKIKSGRVIVLFDEISWMGFKDPNFLGKLKAAWDIYFKKNPKLILILCGSASAWIEKNIISSSGFLGRISYTLTLEELSLPECNEFWKKYGNRISAYEKFKILSVIGGVPRYLEEVAPAKTAEENINNLCFKKGGMLVREFENIFTDLFSIRSDTYKKIVRLLVDGSLEYDDICKKLKVEKTGYVSELLDDLIKSGFIKKDFTWSISSQRPSKIAQYRLSDNYLRFYLKYVEKHLSDIENNVFNFKSVEGFPGWMTILGLQFENLVLNNLDSINQMLGLKPENIVTANPYFQRKTKRYQPCQIDYLIQTRFNTLFVCEIKFSKQEIGMSVVEEVQQKIKHLVRPKGFSCFPVLIHVNGVSDGVLESNYFSEVLDFGKILTN